MYHNLKRLPWALVVSTAVGCSSETKTDRQEVKQQASQAVAGRVQKAADTLQAWTKDGSELKTKLTTAYDNLNTVLQEIKDSETAKAAVARLQESDKTLSELVQLADKLPAAVKPVVATFAKSGAEKLTTLISELERREEVGDTLRPVLEAIRTKLEKFQSP